MRMLALFCIKTNLRENRLFAAGGRLVAGKGTQNVKICTEKLTRVLVGELTC